jgi:predicted DNA-binding protein
MAITKMGARRKARLNDSTLTIRLPKVIEEQLVQVSHAQFKAPSQVVRDLILQYIQTQAFLANAPVQSVNQSSVRQGDAKPSAQVYNPIYDPASPEYDEWA